MDKAVQRHGRKVDAVHARRWMPMLRGMLQVELPA